MTPDQLTIGEAQTLLRQRKLSSLELVQAVLDRVIDVDNDVKAYLTLAPEAALERARQCDTLRAAGEHGPLLGIPLAIKDNMCLQGIPTTCGSRILESFVPPYDAPVVAQLRDAGAVFLGKTNLDEFAMGS